MDILVRVKINSFAGVLCIYEQVDSGLDFQNHLSLLIMKKEGFVEPSEYAEI